MKKLLIACMVLLTVVAFCACNNESNQNDGTNTQLTSDTDINDFENLSSLPEYKEAGTVVTPWDDPEATSGFWVTGATLDAMKAYGEKLVKDGWTLNESVEDYDPEAVLYYDSKDGEKIIQLKFMAEEYIRVTLGTPEAVANLQ